MDDEVFLDPFQQRLLQRDLENIMENMEPVTTGDDLSMEFTQVKNDIGEDKGVEAVGGKLSLHKRIVNGWKATEETKYFCMTMRKINGNYYRGICGATLIADQWAVTAAHCVSNTYKNDMRDKMGALFCNAFTLTERDNGGKDYQILDIETIIEHPNHRPQTASPSDICLLKLTKAANPYFNRIKVANPDYMTNYVPDGSQLRVSGFGQTGINERTTVHLEHAYVPKVSWDDCENIMGKWNFDQSMMCAGGNGRADACGGDSGGPLVSTRNDVPVLVGIVSWGYKCNVAGYPGVYADISKFVDWIRSETDNAPGLQIVSMPNDAISVGDSIVTNFATMTTAAAEVTTTTTTTTKEPVEMTAPASSCLDIPGFVVYHDPIMNRLKATKCSKIIHNANDVTNKICQYQRSEQGGREVSALCPRTCGICS